MAQHHVILGGAGFVGRHVASQLAFLGHRVTVVARPGAWLEFPHEVAGQVSWRHLDLGVADMDALVENADVVHHYVWSSIPASANAAPWADLRDNVGLTLRLLDALRARGKGCVVFASSGGTVYGKLHYVPVAEDHPLAPITAYGAGKATAELYLKLYRSLHGIDCRIARIANPYGAGQDVARGLGAVTTFLNKALAGETIEIWGTGEVVRDYIHISDVAEGLARLACAPRSDDAFVFNIGSGSGLSLNAVIEALERELGRSLSVRRTEPRRFDVPVSVLAIDRARHFLQWSPRLSFAQGLRSMVADLHAGRNFSSLSETLMVESGSPP